MYSLDTSAILDGWVRYYPPDIFPQLWLEIEALIEAGKMLISEEVLVELKKKDDDIYKWLLSRKEKCSVTDENIQKAASEILSNYPRLVDTRKNRSSGDAFVIAVAMINNCAVVTAEGRTGKPDQPNIPDVCDGLGIRCLSLLELIRNEGWSFPGTT